MSPENRALVTAAVAGMDGVKAFIPYNGEIDYEQTAANAVRLASEIIKHTESICYDIAKANIDL